MKISIKTTGLDMTSSMQSYVEEKLGSLTRYIKRYDETGAAELRVEIARTTRHHRHGEVFMAEGNLRLPKSVLRGVEEGVDARAAVDALKRTLRIEIDKYKTKLSPKPKTKGARPSRPGK